MSSASLPAGKRVAPHLGLTDSPRHDRDWLIQAANGDLAAFESLYRHYEKRIYQYVYLLARDRAIAEDVVVETMLAVWRGAAGFAHTSRVSTWIFGIARHKALDALRRAARRREDVSLDEAEEVPDPVEAAADGVNREQEARLLRAAIGRLSREHQEVLHLVFYDELPYEEVAALLSVPLNTVKTRVYYAKQQLERQLEGLGQCRPAP